MAVKGWWQQPDQFETMTAILRQRGLIRPTQLVLASIATVSGLVPLTALVASVEVTPLALSIDVAAGLYIALAAGFFLTRWPSRKQSQLLGTGGALVIAGWSLLQSDTTLRFLACAVMAISGGYFAVFHTTKLMSLNFALATSVSMVAVVRLAHQATLDVAVASSWVLGLLNLAMALGARGLSRAMTLYATHAYDDPLTGLLNRRGWTDVLSRQLREPPPGHTHLAVLLIDLDNFKRINDTHGHSDGDLLLIDVAQLLRQHCPSTAAICRAGGEEFLVTYPTRDTDPPSIAPHLCRAIAELSQQITASIGSTVVVLRDGHPQDTFRRIEDLTKTVDAAMYTAKRNGGNQTHHTESGSDIRADS